MQRINKLFQELVNNKRSWWYPTYYRVAVLITSLTIAVTTCLIIRYLLSSQPNNDLPAIQKVEKIVNITESAPLPVPVVTTAPFSDDRKRNTCETLNYRDERYIKELLKVKGSVNYWNKCVVIKINGIR